MQYTILQINDRSKHQTEANKKYLKEFKYINTIDFVNGNLKDASVEINKHGIKTDVWSPFDERTMPPLPGEYGYWASLLNILTYIVNNKVSMFLALEDDAELNSKSATILKNTMSELPSGWDFLSLFHTPGDNPVTLESSIDKNYIHKAINQGAASIATVYSFEGAKKILELAKEIGVEYTFDCFIFKYCKLDLLNGYSIIPDTNIFAKHDYDFSKSTIDPENKRQNVDFT